MSENVLSFKSFAKQMNNRIFADYFFRLKLLATSRFAWENLPNKIDEKWIEKFLFTHGSCMFFDDKYLGEMVAKCNISGELNEYDEPTFLHPYGTNYHCKKHFKNGKECVLIRNNDDMLPTANSIQIFAYKLTNIDRTIDININAMKTPVLVKCSERQRMTLKNIFNQWNGNEPIIYGAKELDMDGVEALKIDAPVYFPQLQTQKHAVWNEAMTFLGINNANMDKRERLVDDEVQANNEQVSGFAQIMLKSRKKACEDINNLFGTEISVRLRSMEEIESIMNNSGTSLELE